MNKDALKNRKEYEKPEFPENQNVDQKSPLIQKEYKELGFTNKSNNNETYISKKSLEQKELII